MYFRKQGGKSGRQTSPFILSALNYWVLQGTCRPVMDCLSSSPFCHHCLTSDNSWMTPFPQDFFIQDFRRKCKTLYQDLKTYSSAPIFPFNSLSTVKMCDLYLVPVPSSTLCWLYSIYYLLLVWPEYIWVRGGGCGIWISQQLICLEGGCLGFGCLSAGHIFPDSANNRSINIQICLQTHTITPAKTILSTQYTPPFKSTFNNFHILILILNL